MSRFSSIAVFLFCTLALAVSSGYSVGAVLLFLGSATLLWNRPSLGLTGADRQLMGVLLAYFAIYAASMALHGDPMRDYDAPARPLLAVPVLLLLLRYPPRPGAWWASVALGAVGGAVYGAWQYWGLHMPRPQGSTSNAIHYGNVSMLLGMLSMAGLSWAARQPRKLPWMVLLAVGLVAGVFGSVISGSRGGWLALPICALLFCLQYRNTAARRPLYAGLAVSAILLVAVGALPGSPIRERAEIGVDDVTEFSRTGNVETSIGQRFEMWRTAAQMVEEKPLQGWGRLGYMQEKVDLVKQGKMTPMVENLTNAHNDYLDAQVKHGVLGLLALLALFLVPLRLFARALSSDRSDAAAVARQPYALAGVMLCLCFILFGTTTTSLTLNIGVMMLSFPMVMLWAQLRRAVSAPAA